MKNYYPNGLLTNRKIIKIIICKNIIIIKMDRIIAMSK